MLEEDRVDPTKMTTHEFPFEEVDEAYHLMESKEDGVIKPLVDFE
jgi:threonine dehydrogenase-like Zn-dependent dehydrogenase